MRNNETAGTEAKTTRYLLTLGDMRETVDGELHEAVAQAQVMIARAKSTRYGVSVSTIDLIGHVAVDGVFEGIN